MHSNWGSISNLCLIETSTIPFLLSDIDNTLTDTDDENIREDRVDYNNRSSNSRLVLSYLLWIGPLSSSAQGDLSFSLDIIFDD